MNAAQFTEQMRKMLPQWMKMAKDPQSVGAQFLSVFGMEFEEIQRYLDMVLGNQFIGTADIGQIDITYKVPLALPIVTDVKEVDTVIVYKDNQRHSFLNVKTIRKFYMAHSDESVCILDRKLGLLYIRPGNYLMEGSDIYNPIDYVEINGTAHYEYSLHHIWNSFDEFGLLLGIERLYGERNAEFKERILDVFRRPGNSTKEGLVNALSRELGIEDKNIKVEEFANLAFRESLLNADGSPSKKLLSYVDQVNRVLGFTWDNMSWGEAYWRSIEENNLGLEYLPHVWDASTDKWKDTEFQSGIGDGNDLLVTAPKEESNERNFKYSVGLRGRRNGAETIDPEIHFKYKIVARGSIPNEDYRPEEYRYTVVAAEIVKLRFIIRAFQQHWKTTIRDFKPGVAGYVPDGQGGVEIVKGTTMMSDPTSRYLKVSVEMETLSQSDSPIMDKLHIKWKNPAGTTNTFTFDTQDDFTRNIIPGQDTRVDTEMSDMSVTKDGTLELGYGDFYHKIDTIGSWREGTDTNIQFNNNGTIQLKLPK